GEPTLAPEPIKSRVWLRAAVRPSPARQRRPTFQYLTHGLPMSDHQTAPTPQDDNQLIAERREKLRALREAQAAGGGVAFPNNFKPAHRAAQLHLDHSEATNEALEAASISVSVAGRMMLKRVMGKASFATIQDGSLGDVG